MVWATSSSGVAEARGGDHQRPAGRALDRAARRNTRSSPFSRPNHSVRPEARAAWAAAGQSAAWASPAAAAHAFVADQGQGLGARPRGLQAGLGGVDRIGGKALGDRAAGLQGRVQPGRVGVDPAGQRPAAATSAGGVGDVLTAVGQPDDIEHGVERQQQQGRQHGHAHERGRRRPA